MFAAHLSSISIARSEPDPKYNFAIREEKLEKYFARAAEKIVIGDVIKNPLKSANKEKRIKAIEESIEKDERFKTIKSFMESWNFWRGFYFDLPELQPKLKAQLTSIENAILFCEEQEYDLHMMIGCIHFASQKKKFMPAFSAITTYGEEIYKYYDRVISDIDKSDYQQASMERF